MRRFKVSHYFVLLGRWRADAHLWIKRGRGGDSEKCQSHDRVQQSRCQAIAEHWLPDAVYLDRIQARTLSAARPSAFVGIFKDSKNAPSYG